MKKYVTPEMEITSFETEAGGVRQPAVWQWSERKDCFLI